MTISMRWLKDYLPNPISKEFLAQTLTDLGLEVEGMHTVGASKNTFEHVVVGEIVSCQKHADADKLSVTKVNVGAPELLNIVCGAPNVAAGQKVWVSKIGAVLHTFGGETIKIKVGKIRGIVSEGMICAEDELGLSSGHDGIMILPSDMKVGAEGKDYLNTEHDTVIEIGLTPNRSDAMSHLGVAADVAARLTLTEPATKLITPDVSSFKVDNHNLSIEVVVEDFVGCPRFSGVCIENITIGESPEWLKKYLGAIGVNSINNVVDITNFVLHECGQPLHAYDYDKISGKKLIVGLLATGTEFTSLKKNDSGEYVKFKLDASDLMICDAKRNGLCIAGVIGNPHEGVSPTTTRIFLESAYFNGKRLRQTSFRHNTRTDAAKTFEKGTDPNNTLYALKRAALLIKEYAGGTMASEIVDIYPNAIKSPEITLRYSRVDEVIGEQFKPERLHAILEALQMPILLREKDFCIIRVPTNKPDVVREIDVIEEILRIHGFNNVPLPQTMRTAMVASPTIETLHIQDKISDYLSAQGFNECMGLSLTTAQQAIQNLGFSEENLVYLANSANVHLDILRPTMLMSALKMVTENQNRQANDLKLFEFGKTYSKEGEKFNESRHLSLTLTGKRAVESWMPQYNTPTDFFLLKSYVNNVLGRLNVHQYQETVLTDGIFEYGVEYHRGNSVLVEFGKVAPHLSKKFDVKSSIFFADFSWDTILQSIKPNTTSFAAISRFPTVRRDLALTLDKKITYNSLAQAARKTEKKRLKAINLFDVFEDETKLGAGKKSYALSFIFEDAEKTMNDSEIDSMMSALQKVFETQFGASVRN